MLQEVNELSGWTRQTSSNASCWVRLSTVCMYTYSHTNPFTNAWIPLVHSGYGRFTSPPLMLHIVEYHTSSVWAACLSMTHMPCLRALQMLQSSIFTTTKTNSVAFSPQANYTDWATTTCWRNLVPTFKNGGVLHGHRGRTPTVVNLSFLDCSRYFSFK
jgi:hypothetical protein